VYKLNIPEIYTLQGSSFRGDLLYNLKIFHVIYYDTH
jgi:hypothetical protein